MVNLLIRLLVSAGAVLLAQWISQALVDAQVLSRPLIVVSDLTAAVIFAVVLGLLNALVRPVLLLLTCPLSLLTLGLFVFVVNAVVFWLTTIVVGGVQVDGFLGALYGAIIVSVCSSIANNYLE
jgi:putative membrane protein